MSEPSTITGSPRWTCPPKIGMCHRLGLPKHGTHAKWNRYPTRLISDASRPPFYNLCFMQDWLDERVYIPKSWTKRDLPDRVKIGLSYIGLYIKDVPDFGMWEPTIKRFSVESAAWQNSKTGGICAWPNCSILIDADGSVVVTDDDIDPDMAADIYRNVTANPSVRFRDGFDTPVLIESEWFVPKPKKAKVK